MRPHAHSSQFDSELPLSQYETNTAYGALDLFNDSEEAAAHINDPGFIAIYNKFHQLAEEEEERTDEAAPDLPPEDDSGNTEYKLMLCGLTIYKVRKRTTQMAFRLTVSCFPSLASQLLLGS